MKDQAQLQPGLAGGFPRPVLTVKVSPLYRDVVLVGRGSLWHQFTTGGFPEDSKVQAGPMVGWCLVALWWQ